MGDSMTKERQICSILRFSVHRAKFDFIFRACPHFFQSLSSLQKKSSSFFSWCFSCPRRPKGNTLQADEVKCG